MAVWLPELYVTAFQKAIHKQNELKFVSIVHTNILLCHIYYIGVKESHCCNFIVFLYETLGSYSGEDVDVGLEDLQVRKFQHFGGTYCLHLQGMWGDWDVSSLCVVRWRVVLWLKLLFAGLSPLRPGFVPGSIHVGFVVDKVALGQAYLWVLHFPQSVSFHHPPYSYNIRGWTICLVVAAVQRWKSYPII
jgi:hypothetical protein